MSVGLEGGVICQQTSPHKRVKGGSRGELTESKRTPGHNSLKIFLKQYSGVTKGFTATTTGKLFDISFFYCMNEKTEKSVL